MIEVACPSRETLRRYLQGNFDSAQVDSLEDHLELCRHCEETVAELEDTNDSLMRHLPLAASGNVQPDAQVPVWIQRLKAGPTTNHKERLEQQNFANQPEPVANGCADGLTSYELLEVLGRGGMGVVYRGRHRQLGRPVAVKVVRPKLVSATEAHRRFDREIQIVGGLNHPGIVMATDAGRVGPAAYLVMELIDGVDLARLLRSAGPLDVGEACEVARQIAVALSAAHSAGAVHRDVKPSNVMIDRTGHVKLLDFGLACLIELSGDHSETSLGRLIGTLDYMAPEQAEGVRVQASADLYGLGATLFYLLAGRPPHAGDQNRSLLAQLKALSCEDPPHLVDVRLDMPQEVSDLVAQLLARNPADRPESAAEVADRLAMWADPNAKESLAEMIPIVDRADDVEATARSFLELVGREAEQATSKRIEQRPMAADGNRRRVGGWLLGLGGFAVAVLGIVLLIRTPEGTLRIESDVDNVEVELVDERQATKKLEIDQGAKDTTLRAGRYQVRIAGSHSGVKIDKDEITLHRGEQVVARITQSGPAGDGKDDPNSSYYEYVLSQERAEERVYKGKSETEWQRLFEAETEPVAKLQAGSALLQLAAVRPSPEQLDRILAVGEEIVRSAYGDDSLIFGLNRAIPPQWVSRWPLNSGNDDYSEFGHFLNHVNEMISQSPPQDVARILTRAVAEGNDPRAAFACSLIGWAAFTTLSEPALAQESLSKLDSPQPTHNRAAVVAIVRSRLSQHATEEQRKLLASDLIELAKRLSEDAKPQLSLPLSKPELNRQLSAALIKEVALLPNWPPELHESLARLLLSEMRNGRMNADHAFNPFYNAGGGGGFGGGGFTAYGSLDAPLAFPQAFLEKWVLVANDYLRAQTAPPYEPATGEVIRSLGFILRSGPAGDESPLKETAAILTEQLRGYYSDDPNSTTDQSVEDLLPASPVELLTQIVRITGKIPDFVRDRDPVSASVVRRLKEFKSLLNAQYDRRLVKDFDSVTGLFDVAPYHVMKLSLGETTLTASTQIIVRGQGSSVSPNELLYATSSLTEDRNNRRSPPADPLLLLAMLADLTGASEAQDARIASIVQATYRSSQPGKLPNASGLKDHLQNLLASQLHAREHAKRMLREMAAKAKSQALVDAIREIDPTIEPRVVEGASQTPAGQPASQGTPADEQKKAGGEQEQPSAAERGDQKQQSAATDERVYRGRAESEWQRLFLAETDLAAKLDAGSALLTLAAERPTEAQIEQILSVGEEVVRAAYGADALAYVLSTPSSLSTASFGVGGSAVRGAGRGGGRGGRGRGRGGAAGGFGSGGRSTRTFEDQAHEQLQSLPLEMAVTQLCQAAINGSDERAAFALRLLTFPNPRPIINAGPSAAPIVFREFDVPLTGLDRSALLLVARLKFAGKTSREEQLPVLTPHLVRLSSLLVEAPDSSLVDSMKDTLLSEAKRQQDWLPEQRRVFAQIIVSKLEDKQQAAAVVANVFDPLADRSFSSSDTFSSDIVSSNFQPPYERRFIDAARRRLSYFLDHWVGVANIELQRAIRPSPVANKEMTGALIASLDHVLPLYSESDEWPVTETAETLTRMLNQYYAVENSPLVSNFAELLPATPATVLTQIVRVTGQIPESAVRGRPRSREVLDRIPELRAWLQGKQERAADANAYAGMYDEAPLEVIRLAIGEADPRLVTANGNNANLPVFARRILTVASSGTGVEMSAGGSTGRPDSIVDPLLLLAALTEFSGEAEPQDARIATLVAETRTYWRSPIQGPDPRSHGLARHVKNLLASQLKAREHAKRMLREMAAKAKSQALVDAIREIDPTIEARVIEASAQPAAAQPTSSQPVETEQKGGNRGAQPPAAEREVGD